MGGAVNIITRLPEKKFDTSVTTSYGSYNTFKVNLKHSANLNRFGYFVTFDRRKSDGHIENSDYSGYSITGKLVYHIKKDTHLSFQGKYFDGNKHEPGTIEDPLQNYWNDYERGAVDVSINHRWKKNDFFLKVYRNFGTHQFSDGWDSQDFTNGIMTRLTTKIITGSELTIGGDYRFFGGESFNSPQGEWDKKEGAFFVQNQQILSSQWILSSGLRLQLDSLYGQELCPHLGIVFHATDSMLFRAAVSKGFRSPQLNELYMFPSANPDLKPEKVWNYELGFEQDIGKLGTFKASVFHMKGNDLIQTISNPHAPPLYIFANAGEFSFYGAELELELFFNRFLYGHIAYSYLNTGDQTKGRPGQKIDILFRFNKKNFSAAIQGQYITDYFADNFSQNPIPSYFILNSRVNIPVINAVDVLLEINNILNKSYQIYGEFPGMSAGLYRMPGRNLQIGIGIKL
jgi:outer membrane receptor protein involved in Fe transport